LKTIAIKPAFLFSGHVYSRVKIFFIIALSLAVTAVNSLFVRYFEICSY